MPTTGHVPNMKKLVIALLCVLFTSKAQAMDFALEAGYGHAYPLGGTESGNLRHTEFSSVAAYTSLPVWQGGDFVLIQDVGLDYIHFQEPDGFGVFAFESTTLEWVSFYPFTPYLSARLGVGGADVNQSWTTQSDGLLFLLQPSIGLEFNEKIRIGYALHHLSNAGINHPNCGINSHFIYVSIGI